MSDPLTSLFDEDDQTESCDESSKQCATENSIEETEAEYAKEECQKPDFETAAKISTQIFNPKSSLTQ